MSPIRSAVLIAWVLLWAGPVQALVPLDAVCGLPEVLDIVADDIARGGTATVIVPGDIGQVPTSQPNTVRCAVRVSTQYFDTNRFGYAPQHRPGILEYSVRAGRNGLLVDGIGTIR